MGRTRNLTRSEREAAQARFDQMTDAETERLRDAADKAIAAMTSEERRERAAQAINKYGGPA